MIWGAVFHHLGVGVRNTKAASLFLQRQGYAVGETVYDPLQKVRLAMCTHPTEPSIELIAPADEDGPLTKLLRESEGTAYHICYRVESSKEAVDSLVEAGLRIATVSTVKPAVLFPGHAVSFHQIIGFGLIELVEPISSR
jgi:methylmalonyl-CoA/ethylmalonyl-CoA epimerase